jgi:uncharacterized protein (TIGR03437 family)
LAGRNKKAEVIAMMNCEGRDAPRKKACLTKRYSGLLDSPLGKVIVNKKAAFALVLLAQAGFSAVLPLAFEPNSGQTDHRVRYLARGPQGTLWLTRDEAVLGTRQGALRVRLEGGSRNPNLEAEDALPGKTNYFIGKDSSRWRHDIPLFGKVRYRGVYPGIDVVFYGNPNDLEYDFVLAPGADAHKIRLAYAGARGMRVDAAGDLIFSIGDSEIRQHRPKIYQGTHAIDGRYQILGRNRVGFSIAEYDHGQSLTIDPVITYSTYFGGSSFDQGQAIAMDAQGNLYVTGQTGSADFPVIGGVGATFPTTPGAASQALVPFVAKLNPSLSGAASVVWSTYLGGGHNGSFSVAIAVDPGGNVYAGGATLSSDDFAVTRNAFQQTPNCVASINGASSNCLSGWISKIAPGGNQLIYSSFLSGGYIDTIYGIAVDNAGNAYLAGATASPAFPVRGAAYQSRLVGGQNGFISKVSPDGSTLLYSTYFGGEGSDGFSSIALDSSGFVYVGGASSSLRFPVSQNAYQLTLQRAQSAGVLAKLDLTQEGPFALLYGTYIGGPSPSTASTVNALALDSQGNIFAAGSTTDASFPVTAAAAQSQFGGVVPSDTGYVTGDAFVLKLNPNAQGAGQLTYSSFFGGAGNDSAAALSIDTSGRVLISGTTGSSNLPVTPDAYECCFSNPGNFSKNSTSGFSARIDPSKSGPAGLLYATYVGGSPAGMVSLAGSAMNSAGTVAALFGGIVPSNFPVTASAFKKTNTSKSMNAYLATINFGSAGPLITAVANAASFKTTGFSPGMIFTIVGSAFGPVATFGPQLDATGRVETLVSGTEVLVDGVPVPLIYGSATLINAVAPYELAAKVGQTVFVQVVSNGVAGNVVPVTITATAPGIFYSAGGQGAILNQDSSLNGGNNPAAKGSYVSIYCTGEGQTTPAGVDGSVSNQPVAQLPHPVVPVSVTIGGIAVPQSDIYYAGSAPQAVAGLLQLTAKIPANAASGNIPIVVTFGSQSSQTGVTVAVQ